MSSISSMGDLDILHLEFYHRFLDVVVYKLLLALCFDFCNSCQLAKSHRLPFVNAHSRVIKPFDLVHFDLWGASAITFVTSIRYFLLFIDDYPLPFQNLKTSL